MVLMQKTKRAPSPIIIGHALKTAWKNTDETKELELIVSGSDRARDVLSAMISPYGKIGHVIESAGIISFRTDYEYANAMINAWLGEKNSLLKTYKSTFKSITCIEPNLKLKDCSINDFDKQEGIIPKRSDMWNLEMIGAYDAHGVSQGQGTSVAVIDTGADYSHDEISHAFGSNKGVNIVTGTNDIYDRQGHGTHVSGTIAGKDTGVAPLARLYAVKVFEDDYAYTSDVIAGIDWSIREGVNVINMSLGGPTPSPAMQAIIDVAVKKGVYVVAAAGNEGRGPSYPASCEGVVSVAAVDATKKHAYFSNIYHTNDISAPGVDILSCVPGGYRTASGTSMASPHTAGSLALLVSHKKRDDYEGIIKENAEKLADVPGEKYEDVYGAGLLRVDESLEYPATMAKILFTAKDTLKRVGRWLY